MHDCIDMHDSPAQDLCPRHWHCNCQANTRPRFSCCRLACALCETVAHAACNRLHTSTNPPPGRNTAPLHMKQTSAPERIGAKANTDPDVALRHDSLRSSSNSDGVACCFVSFKRASCSSRDVDRVCMPSPICQVQSISNQRRTLHHLFACCALVLRCIFVRCWHLTGVLLACPVCHDDCPHAWQRRRLSCITCAPALAPDALLDGTEARNNWRDGRTHRLDLQRQCTLPSSRRPGIVQGGLCTEHSALMHRRVDADYASCPQRVRQWKQCALHL